MKREPVFTPLDLMSWKRGQIFYYFSKMAPTGYSLTVKLDITKMTDEEKEADYIDLQNEILQKKCEYLSSSTSLFKVF